MNEWKVAIPQVHLLTYLVSSIFKLLGVLKAVEHLFRVLNNAWTSQVAVVVGKKKKKTCLPMQET